MKRILLLIPMLLLSSYVYSQDWNKELKKSDDLQRKYKRKIENLQTDTANAHKDIAQYDAEIMKLKTSVKDYNDNIKKLNSQAFNLTRENNAKAGKEKIKTDSVNKLKRENEFLQNKFDDLKQSLDELENKIRNEHISFDDDVNAADTKKRNAQKMGMEKGKKDVRNSIAQKYNGKTLDEMVNIDKYGYIKDDTDTLFYGADKSGDVKMLIKYYKVTECLNIKYNEQTVEKSIVSLNSVIRKYAQKGVNSLEARELKELLDGYKDINDAFEALVDSLDVYNQKEFTGDPEKIAKKKKSYYMKKISDFAGYYDNFDKYPYICERFFKIISIKSSDEGINENVRYLLQ